LIPRHTLRDGYCISRIIKGGWHLAGDHGVIDPNQAISDMARFVEAGVTTFDCADIYTGVEELIGKFRRRYPTLATQVQVHTKFVPDLSDLATLDSAYVERIIDRSLQRLGVERLDLVQFHWWEYRVRRYVEIALELERLRRLGKIGHIGVTNFDTPRLREIVAAGVPIAFHQLQYSLLDNRPDAEMINYCRSRQIALLCYGTVAGGFLSERWLGQPEPGTAGATLGNRSLIKYKLIIDDFGGWDALQRLLLVLSQIAAKHRTDLASIASRVILDRSQVAAVIVGATNTAHLPAHAQLASVQLDADDLTAIAGLTEQRNGPEGDVYALERDRSGRHGRIMKYELNARPESTPFP
jgi:aryl-alcohol dehydrogenase-like predicted oxidoreductase